MTPRHMKRTLLMGLALALGFSGLTLSAESIETLPVKVVNGKLYHYYEVKTKETIYSLCRKLDISKDKVIEYNPAVADGLKSGMTLYFPFTDGSRPTAVVNNQPETSSDEATTHKVEKGETIFGIAKKYGTSTEEVIRLNPSIANGLKAGQTIIVKESRPVAPVETITSYEAYVVKEKETFYSIAKSHNITVEQLEAANPNTSVLKAGQLLNVPVFTTVPAATETTVIPAQVESSEAENAAIETTPAETVTITETTAMSDALSKKEHIDITVMLPFMLNQDPVGKEGRRFTEFYKGFLIAVDSLRNNGTPITVRAYDTAASLDSVKSILRNPDLKKSSVIIAPDNFSQMVAVGEFGRDNGILVINPFVVKDETYLSNPMMLQANLPSDKMQTKAINYIPQLFYGYTPVIVGKADAPGDKAEFISELKKNLTEKGIEYKEILYPERLTVSALAELDKSGKYVFFPTSGRQAEVNKILPALVEWKDKLDSPLNVTVFGYPEWITFRGETLSNMQALNARLYSRFYIDPLDMNTRKVEDAFRKWYGGEMENAMPRQGLLGFDMGMYLIKTLSGDNNSSIYRGTQNGFKFVNADGGGMYNDVLYIVTFRPSGYTDQTIL